MSRNLRVVRGTLCLWLAVSAAHAQLPPEPVAPPAGPLVEIPPEPEAPPALPSVVPPPAPVPAVQPTVTPTVVVRAHEARYDPASRLLRLTGGVVVSTREQTIAASSAVLSTDTGTIEAEGPIVMADARQIASCHSATVNIRSQTGVLHDVRLEVRQPMDAETRARIVELGQAPAGPYRALVTGRTVELLGRDRLRVHQAYVTTCDCRDDGPVPWSVRARSAEVVNNDYALVMLPTFYVMGLPVLVLPFAALPIGGRQSGLLFPEFRFQDGIWFSQPLYLTLGRSADVTVAPGIIAERGPRLFLEGRFAPAPDSYLEAQFTSVRDAKFLRQHGVPVEPAPEAFPYQPQVWDALALQETRTPTGEALSPNRFSARFVARSRVGRASLGADVNAVSDKYVPGDYGVSLGERLTPYLRSSAQMSAGYDDLHGVLQVLTFQDLNQPNVSFFNAATGALGHRLPTLQLRILERPLLPSIGSVQPPLVGKALASVDVERVLGNTDPGATNEDFTGRDVTGDQGGRQAGATRFVLQPEIALPVRFGRFGEVRASLVGRESVFIAAGGRVSDVTRVTGRLRAETEISARMPTRLLGTVVHRIRPSAGYEGILFARSSIPDDAAPWLDEADRFTRFHAVGGGLWQELRIGNVFGAPLRAVAEATGAVDLLDRRRQEWRWRSLLELRGFSTSLRTAVDPVAREVMFLQTAIDVGRAPFAQVHLGYTRISGRTPRFMLAGADELLGGLRLAGPEFQGGADRLDGFVAIPVGRLRLDYGAEVAFPGAELNAGSLNSDSLGQVEPRVLSHGGSAVYTSECNCWSAGARVRFFPGRGQVISNPVFSFTFSLSGPEGEMALLR